MLPVERERGSGWPLKEKTALLTGHRGQGGREGEQLPFQEAGSYRLLHRTERNGLDRLVDRLTPQSVTAAAIGSSR